VDDRILPDVGAERRELTERFLEDFARIERSKKGQAGRERFANRLDAISAALSIARGKRFRIDQDLDAEGARLPRRDRRGVDAKRRDAEQKDESRDATGASRPHPDSFAGASGHSAAVVARRASNAVGMRRRV